MITTAKNWNWPESAPLMTNSGNVTRKTSVTADAFNSTTHEYPQRQRPPGDKRMSPAERRHSEGHPTTRQRQRTNSKTVAQTNNGNHQTTNKTPSQTQILTLYPEKYPHLDVEPSVGVGQLFCV